MKHEHELTKLQQIIVASIIEGQTSKEIADELGLHLATIVGERNKIMKKFNSIQELIQYYKDDAQKTDLVPLSAFGLTETELKVCFLLINAYTTKQIGDKLGKSHRTIDAQRTSILKKVGVKNKNELFVLAKENKWFEDINLDFSSKNDLTDKELLFVNVIKELKTDDVKTLANNLGFLDGFTDKYKFDVIQEMFESVLEKLKIESFEDLITITNN
jgi:DNA-binding CsgD family transcriptional regulator